MTKILPSPKRAIFEAASEIMAAQGYAALTMRAIATHTGVALGTIYNYYPDKHELVQDMMLVHWVDFTQRQAAIASSRLVLHVRLYSFFKELGAFVQKFRDTWQNPDLYVEPDDLQANMQGQAGYLARVIECVEDMLTEELTRRGGVMRLRHGAHDTARFIVMNFMAMIQMPVFQYELFEMFLKDLLG